MHSFKIILISLAPVLAIPAMSLRDIDSDEPFDFGQGFLVPENVSIDDYDSTPMISLPSLNIRDLATLEEPLAPELGNFTEFDLDTRAPKETKVFFGKPKLTTTATPPSQNPSAKLSTPSAEMEIILGFLI